MCAYYVRSTMSPSPRFDVMAAIGSGSLGNPDDNVADLLQSLNLTVEEEDIAEFSDNEDIEESVVVEWALFGKVLSSATTIFVR